MPGTAQRWRTLTIAASVLLLGGCGHRAGVRLESLAAGDRLEPGLPTAVYTSSDVNTADIYLTDLPLSAFERPLLGPPDTAPAGQVIHIHMFLAPRAGRTPISSTASNCTVRYLLLSGPAAGVYAGGGFLLPDAPAGGSAFAGRVLDATLTPAGAVGPFEDRLGPSRFWATFNARRDPAACRAIAATLGDALAALESPAPSDASAQEPAP